MSEIEKGRWQDAFDDRHQFDVYPEHFMTGLRNEFCAGWQAALKNSAMQEIGDEWWRGVRVVLTDEQRSAIMAASKLFDGSGEAKRADVLRSLLGIQEAQP